MRFPENRYHKDIFLPRELEREALASARRWAQDYSISEHAKRVVDGWAISDMPRPLPVEACVVIEVTTDEHDDYRKCLLRFSYDARRDLCVALTKFGLVPTVFFNDKADHHSTLNHALYVHGERAGRQYGRRDRRCHTQY